MYAHKNYDVITLNDDGTMEEDTGNSEKPLAMKSHDNCRQTPRDLLKQRKKREYFGVGNSSVPSKNAAFSNARLPLHDQIQKQKQEEQRRTLTELPKKDIGDNSESRMRINQQHLQKQRLAHPLAGSAGATIAITPQHPLGIKKLLNSERKSFPHPLPLVPSKNAAMAINEQHIMCFQQQHRMKMQHQQQLRKASTTSAKVPGSKENGGIPIPIANNILDCGVRWQQALKLLSDSKITPLNKTQNLISGMLSNGASKFTNGKRLHQDHITLFCNNYVEAHNKKATVSLSVAEKEFTGQFQCTFHDCNKRLKDNVMFIYHIWAHVAQQKPVDSDEQFNNSHLLAEQQHIAKANATNNTKNGVIGRGSGAGETVAPVGEQRSDVSRLHTCTECLLEQPTPYRTRLHYHRVHKRGTRPLLDNKHGLNVCNICEQVIDAKSMTAHIAGHHLADKTGQLELPYLCRFSAGAKCQFRTSNRSALLRHFCTKHVGNHVLLCPFCLLTFNVPSANKRRKLVRMHDFVKHMMCHDGDKSLYCSLCVTRVPFSLHQQMKTHQEQHGKHKDDQKRLQWPIQRLVPDKSRAFVSANMSIAQCVECGQMEQNLSTHFGKERRRCNFCAFATRCPLAMERHRMLSQCNTANVARTPFAGWTSSVSVAPHKLDCFSASSSSPSSLPFSSSFFIKFACSFCDTFCFVNVQVLADHLHKVHNQLCSGAHVRLLMHPNKNNNSERQWQTKTSNNIKGKEGEEKQQQWKVDEKLKQYTMDKTKEEMHEAELFGLRRMGDTPLEKEEEEEINAKGQSANATGMTSEQAAMHEWLLTFMPLFHANTFIHCAAKRPEQMRLFSAMKVLDEDGDNGRMGATSAEEELNEHRVKMGLMHDF